MRNKLVKYNARPKLNEPNLLASWPGISNVSITIASYLLKKLGFKKLAEISAYNFFDPIGVMVKDSVIEQPRFPSSIFYYWKNEPGKSDLIIFLGEAQPQGQAYEMANLVLDVADKYQVKRIFTCAAAVTKIHHTEQPRVWGVATNQATAEELAGYNALPRGRLQIAGLNGLLLGIAKERLTEGVCLLGEVPAATASMPNPMAALAIIDVLKRIIDVNLDTTELRRTAIRAREEIKRATADAMGEYINNFTQPIWEQDEEDLNEDMDD